MKKLLFVVSLVLLFCLVVYCQKQAEKPTLPVNTKTELNAIHELFAAWAEAFDKKDVDRICSFITDDFIYPYGLSLRDKKWFRDFYIKWFSEGRTWKLYLPDRFEASGDLAYAVGCSDFTAVTNVTKSEANPTKGCSLYVLKKQNDGSWKVISFK
jgi:ketosteroid isomerase-like protein